MREPYDVFLKEFLQHPAWREVFVKLDQLANDLIMDVFNGSSQEFERRKGKAEGVYEAVSLLKRLINEKG